MPFNNNKGYFFTLKTTQLVDLVIRQYVQYSMRSKNPPKCFQLKFS